MKNLRLSFSYLQCSLCVGEKEEITDADRVVFCLAWMHALRIHEQEVPEGLVIGGKACIMMEFQPGHADKIARARVFLYFKDTLSRLGYIIADTTLSQNKVLLDWTYHGSGGRHGAA